MSTDEPVNQIGLGLFDVLGQPTGAGPKPDPPSPPTGPYVEPPPPSKNSVSAYREWLLTTDGQSVAAYIAEMAQSMLAQGDKRISTKTLVESARFRLKLEINNSYTAFIADDLVRDFPDMLALIERRRRSNKGGG